jgi:hypothetical protein
MTEPSLASPIQKKEHALLIAYRRPFLWFKITLVSVVIASPGKHRQTHDTRGWENRWVIHPPFIMQVFSAVMNHSLNNLLQFQDKPDYKVDHEDPTKLLAVWEN